MKTRTTLLSFLLIAFLMLLPLAGEAQSISRGKKQSTTTTQKKKNNETSKPKTSNKKRAATHKKNNSSSLSNQQEATAYDVTFNCNVADATMFVDGTDYGKPIGTRYLKTGTHSVNLTADYHQNYSTTINVDRNNTNFTFNMTKMTAQELYQKGDNYYDEGNYIEAVKWFRKAAEQGDAQSQSILGYCYMKGDGVQQDNTEAAKWIRKAAEQGDISAQLNLGNMYIYGVGVPQNYSEAVNWTRKAAEQGNAVAQCNLGQMYCDGLGVPRNISMARYWFQKAADQGFEGAIEALKHL